MRLAIWSGMAGDQSDRLSVFFSLNFATVARGCLSIIRGDRTGLRGDCGQEFAGKNVAEKFETKGGRRIFGKFYLDWLILID